MLTRMGRKPDYTELGTQLVEEILSGSEEAVAEFINWRSPDRKQYPQYMSGPELAPLWEARARLSADLVRFIEPWCSEDGVRRRQNSVEAKRRKAEQLQALRERATAADSMAEVLREAYEGVRYSAASLANQPDETAEYLGQLADYIAGEVPEVLEEEPAQQEEKQAAEDVAWDEAAPAEGDAAAEEAVAAPESEEVEEVEQPPAPSPAPAPRVGVGDIPPWLRR
jgi:hypothetical protein